MQEQACGMQVFNDVNKLRLQCRTLAPLHFLMKLMKDQDFNKSSMLSSAAVFCVKYHTYTSLESASQKSIQQEIKPEMFN